MLKPGEWEPWGSWTECSVTCGERTGIHTRTRNCNHKELATTCYGPDSQLKQCYAQTKCPGEILVFENTKILEVNLFAFAYRLFRRDFSPLDGDLRTCILESQVVECSMGSFYTQRFQKLICLHLPTNCFVEISPHSTPCKMSRRVGRNLYETVCRQMQTN